MKLEFEYGLGMMEANLPDSTDIFIPGETVPDPPLLEDVEAATQAIDPKSYRSRAHKPSG